MWWGGGQVCVMSSKTAIRYKTGVPAMTRGTANQGGFFSLILFISSLFSTSRRCYDEKLS